MGNSSVCVMRDFRNLTVKTRRMHYLDEPMPDAWTLYADGHLVAHGSGEFVCECFCKSATAFLDVCRDAVCAANLAEWSAREYQLLCAARNIAAV